MYVRSYSDQPCDAISWHQGHERGVQTTNGIYEYVHVYKRTPRKCSVYVLYYTTASSGAIGSPGPMLLYFSRAAVTLAPGGHATRILLSPSRHSTVHGGIQTQMGSQMTGVELRRCRRVTHMAKLKNVCSLARNRIRESTRSQDRWDSVGVVRDQG